MATKTIQRLRKIDDLISRKNTGTPLELSKKLKVSERCVRNYVNILKDLGAPISYSRKNCTYFYKEEGCFSFRFTKAIE